MVGISSPKASNTQLVCLKMNPTAKALKHANSYSLILKLPNPTAVQNEQGQATQQTESTSGRQHDAETQSGCLNKQFGRSVVAHNELTPERTELQRNIAANFPAMSFNAYVSATVLALPNQLLFPKYLLQPCQHTRNSSCTCSNRCGRGGVACRWIGSTCVQNNLHKVEAGNCNLLSSLCTARVCTCNTKPRGHETLLVDHIKSKGVQCCFMRIGKPFYLQMVTQESTSPQLTF
jgi:hypothetical protein